MNSQKKPRPPIPEADKREIRQRCGFGCVICGLPIYEYEHMTEWAVVQEHVAKDITLLCTQHHREKTNGLLSKKSVIEANASPINKRGNSEPYRFHAQPIELKIIVGSTTFHYSKLDPTNKMVVIAVGSQPIIWFNIEDDYLLLNIILYDKHDNIMLQIIENELIYSTKLWDVTFIGNRLQIKTAKGKLYFSMRFSANTNEILIEKAILKCDGYEVFVGSGKISMPASNNVLEGGIFIASTGLINYGQTKHPSMFHFVDAKKSY